MYCLGRSWFGRPRRRRECATSSSSRCMEDAGLGIGGSGTGCRTPMSALSVISTPRLWTTLWRTVLSVERFGIDAWLSNSSRAYRPSCNVCSLARHGSTSSARVTQGQGRYIRVTQFVYLPRVSSLCYECACFFCKFQRDVSTLYTFGKWQSLFEPFGVKIEMATTALCKESEVALFSVV